MHSALHPWNLSPTDAVALQYELAKQIRLEGTPAMARADIGRIAGVDIGFEDGGETTRAAVVVLAWQPGTTEHLQVIEQVVHREPTRMPYIPGLLSYREVPAALGAFAKLGRYPDLVMVDGQGIAHPRRIGVASHLGLWLELPTIGIAKSRLCGRFEPVGEARLSTSELTHRGETIGVVLRSREKVKPVFVSPGHLIDQASALDWVIRCLHKTKLPEPTRLADRLASRRDRPKTAG